MNSSPLGSRSVFGLPFSPAILLLAAFVHCSLLYLYYVPQPKRQFADEKRYVSSAEKMLAGDPEWHPEPLWPPLYSQVVAGVMTLPGHYLPAVQVIQMLLLILSAVVLGDLTTQLSGSAVAGRVAAFWALAYPPLVAFAHYLWPETLHLFLMLAALWMLVTHRSSLQWSALAGVSIGLALLTKSILMPFVVLLVIAICLYRPGQKELRAAAVFAFTAGLTVLPVFVTNYFRLGTPIIADSAAFNLWLGLNDTSRTAFAQGIAGRAYRDFLVSGDNFVERNEVMWTKVHEHFEERRLTDIVSSQLSRQYFRLFDKESFLTLQLPGGLRVRYEGRSHKAAQVVRYTSYALYAVLLITAPLGYAVMSFRYRRWVQVLLLFVAYNLLLFFWLHVKSRYRLQMLPVFFIGSGCAFAWLHGLSAQVATKKLPKRRLWVAIGTAALLVFFAFAGTLF
ncbi:MAG: glycosyltransferase family 39 protein [bacterium]|nr:glycosyltransferase family 39 protein [bacterium]